LRTPRAWPLRIARIHGRLLTSVAIGALVFVLLPVFERTTTRLLAAWDVGVAIYLILAAIMMSRFDLQLVRRRAAEQDEGGMLVLVLSAAAAVASLAAIVAELGSMRGAAAGQGAPYLALAVATTLLSWTFIQVIFALHYAHEFYGEGRRSGGLQFPADDRPDYWDFAYFSFVIGMTFQVSDVQVTSKFSRRVVLAHGVLSFFFNVAILALMVNIGSEFIK
jgi:uncharacterized membrane protein